MQHNQLKKDTRLYALNIILEDMLYKVYHTKSSKDNIPLLLRVLSAIYLPYHTNPIHAPTVSAALSRFFIGLVLITNNLIVAYYFVNM